jgi:membrane protease YdiL (CAAX protease family)
LGKQIKTSGQFMPESQTKEACNEMINSEGWLASISLSVITFGVIFIVGVLVLPEDDNLNSLMWAGGLIVASKVIVSWFPGQLSFHNPSFNSVIIAIVAAIGIHVILWGWPLAEGYLNHFYSYELFGRIVYAIVLCVIFPVVEEIYFRGLLLPVISLRFGVGNGAILSVIMFILYHMTSKGVLSLALLGGVSTWLAIRTKTLIPSIVMHITFNSIWLIHGVITATK